MCDGRCVDTRIDAVNCNLCGRACMGGQTCQVGACTNASVDSLVFSEVNPGLGTVEVFNGGPAPVNLLNYALQWTLGDGGTGSVALPSYEVPAQGFVVFGRGPPDAGYLQAATVPIKTADFALRLLSPSASGVDFVRSGNSAVQPPTGTTWSGGNAPNSTIATTQSLVRNLFTADSDSAADWGLAPNASPMRVCARPGLCATSCLDLENDRANCGGCGRACVVTQVCRSGECVAGGGQLLISEFRIDPVPMVEVYNPGPNPVPLSGYRVQVASLGTFNFTFPSNGRTLPPGKFVVVYAGAGVDDFSTAYSGSAPPTSSFTDTSAVTLFDGTTGVDFVRFGSSGAVPPSGVSWFGNGATYPPVSSADLSVHRKLDGIDSDDALNWLTYDPSTAGFACQAGMTLCAGRCVNTQSSMSDCGACGTACTLPHACVRGSCGNVGRVVISRISNVAPERIELFNGTAVSSSFDLHTVEWVTESGTDSYSIPAGISVPAGGYLTLIEGTGTSTATTLFMARSVVWATDIAISLKSPSNVGLDFVRTGASTALPAGGTTWTGNNAPNPADTGTEALERNVLLPDTNTAADWKLMGAPSFGATCGAGLSVCGSECVSTTTSTSNCGTCGNICPYFRCASGQCMKSRAGPDNGRVRLVGGANNAGRLEVFANGGWGQVCDDFFDLTINGPNVVCRDLGFDRARSQANATGPNDVFLLDDVTCTGNELTLLDCSHGGLGAENCDASEAIFITCE